MGSIAPQVSSLNQYTCADPGLPTENPTKAYWQHIPHPTLAETRSATLSASTDVAVIGSGITAASVTKTLLENDPSLKVTIFEARGLTSGATGRNGGHLTSAAATNYSLLTEHFGPDMARKIAAFTFANVVRVHEVSSEYGEETREACEIRDVTCIDTFLDEASFESGKESLALLEQQNPSWRGQYTTVNGEEAAKTYGVKDGVGALISPGGAIWPYRLVTRVFAHLLEAHPDRLRIETFTPVTSVSYDPSASQTPYHLSTLRGVVNATRVIYCTNGWTGHLLPALRGKIFPVRGSMTVQKRGSSFPEIGASRSWSWTHRCTYDTKTQIAALGLYYLTQNAKSGDLFLGGEREKISDILTSDDSRVGSEALENLTGLLPQFFGAQGWAQPSSDGVKSAWSGIMGFTADGMPLAGRLSESITGREGQGEWIAAGFNGYGMVNAWLTGEAVAKMTLGHDVSEWFPEAYLVTQDRLQKSLDPEGAFEKLFGLPPTVETL